MYHIYTCDLELYDLSRYIYIYMYIHVCILYSIYYIVELGKEGHLGKALGKAGCGGNWGWRLGRHGGTWGWRLGMCGGTWGWQVALWGGT